VFHTHPGPAALRSNPGSVEVAPDRERSLPGAVPRIPSSPAARVALRSSKLKREISPPLLSARRLRYRVAEMVPATLQSNRNGSSYAGPVA